MDIRNWEVIDGQGIIGRGRVWGSEKVKLDKGCERSKKGSTELELWD